jgi:predicted nuclease with TOPRIM domain
MNVNTALIYACFQLHRKVNRPPKKIGDLSWNGQNSNQPLFILIDHHVNISIVDKTIQLNCFGLIIFTEEPSLQYWKLLAETRRNALAETLEENEKLCNQLEEKDQEIAKWKNQCRSLETKLALVEADKAEMEEILEGYKQMSEMIEGLGEQQEAEVDGGGAEEGRAVDDNGDE